MMQEDLNQANSPSREEWRFPLLARFKNWVIGFGAAAVLILAALYGAYLYMRPVPVEATKPAIAVGATVPAPANSIIFQTRMGSWSVPAKNTPKKIATQASNTPAKVEFVPEIEPLTPAEQDFANRLANFERKIP